MNLKTAKIRILDLDLKGCVYLNHFSHSHVVANFFKRISRMGDGIFWYTMLALTWLLQGLVYSLQIVYLVLGSLCGTLIYKVLKIKTILDIFVLVSSFKVPCFFNSYKSLILLLMILSKF